jgi:pantoate--beta-alanine ligase
MNFEVIRTRKDLGRLNQLRTGGNLCLVPTMGALHEGHLSLVKRAAEIGPVVVSIFVNPTQFGPNEDLDRYPRTLDADLALLEPLGVSAVFVPEVNDMYAAEGGAQVQPGLRAQDLCGGRRPGHFAGVCTVVLKLFGLIRPDYAVFGRKDAQQCLVIGEMVRDLNVPVKLIDAPTVREKDGLALSSRNRFLTPDERGRALCLRRALGAAHEALVGGERSAGALEDIMTLHLAPADMVDYAKVRQVPDLTQPDEIDGRIVMMVAAHVGTTRLIDNMVWNVQGDHVSESTLLED